MMSKKSPKASAAEALRSKPPPSEDRGDRDLSLSLGVAAGERGETEAPSPRTEDFGVTVPEDSSGIKSSGSSTNTVSLTIPESEKNSFVYSPGIFSVQSSSQKVTKSDGGRNI